MPSPSRVRLDVLRFAPMRALLRCAAFPLALQIAALVFVVWVALSGLGVGVGMTRAELMTLRKTNLATLVVWGLWWPGMIAVALFFGRMWCTVCPMEALNRGAQVLARRLGVRQVRLTRFLRAGWITVALYLVIQMLVAGVSMHRMPHYTGLMTLALLGLAATAGVVFSDHRSFCVAFCPASALLSVYGRFTPVQLETRAPSVCAACATRDCVKAAYRDRLDRRSCPSLLQPYRRAPSDGCVTCLQCAKVCPHGNVGLGVVAADAPVRACTPLKPFEVAFMLMAFGFVAHEVFAEVKWLDAFFHAVPEALNALAPSVPFGWFEAVWFLILFPAGIWTVVTLVARFLGYRGELRRLLAAATLGAAPVVAVAHLAKALAKVGFWGGYLPLALRDPRGMETFRQISQKTLQPSADLWALPVVGWMMLLALLFVVVRTSRACSGGQAEGARDPLVMRVGLAASVVVFAAILATWVLPA